MSVPAADAFTVLVSCTACGACLPTCPERCIRVAPAGTGVPLVVQESVCTGCGECAEVCPAEAIVPLAELAGPSRPADLPTGRERP